MAPAKYRIQSIVSERVTVQQRVPIATYLPRMPPEKFRSRPLGRATFSEANPWRKHTRVPHGRSQPSQHIGKIDRRAISEIVPDSYGFPATANTAFDL